MGNMPWLSALCFQELLKYIVFSFNRQYDTSSAWKYLDMILNAMIDLVVFFLILCVCVCLTAGNYVEEFSLGLFNLKIILQTYFTKSHGLNKLSCSGS